MDHSRAASRYGTNPDWCSSRVSRQHSSIGTHHGSHGIVMQRYTRRGSAGVAAAGSHCYTRSVLRMIVHVAQTGVCRAVCSCSAKTRTTKHYNPRVRPPEAPSAHVLSCDINAQ